MSNDTEVLRAPGQCGRCGRNPATGFASEWTGASGEVWYCHGDDDEAPTCYERRNWPETAMTADDFLGWLGMPDAHRERP